MMPQMTGLPKARIQSRQAEIAPQFLVPIVAAMGRLLVVKRTQRNHAISAKADAGSRPYSAGSRDSNFWRSPP